MASESGPDRAPAETRQAPGRSAETVDRIMVGVCGATWLVLLAATVIATVALVRLGTGQAGAGERHSSWLLYGIIAVSTLVIAGAIPLLIRARRTAAAGPAPEPAAPAEIPARAVEAPTEKIRVFGTSVDPYQREVVQTPPVSRLDAVLDRIWLRGTTSLLTAMGLALTGVAIATYLLAVHSETAAWVALGVSGVVTAGMVGILVFFGRKVATAADEAAEHALA